MGNENGESARKVIIAILAVLLIGSFIYIYKMSTEVKEVRTEIVKVNSEKEDLLKQLDELKASYDDAIAKNTSMTEELKKEREKVEKLTKQVKNAKGDVSKFKTEIKTLKANNEELLAQIDALKKENKKLAVQKDSVSSVLVETKKENEGLNKKIEDASKLAVSCLQTVTYRISGSKKTVIERAKKVNLFKIGFSVAENLIAKPQEKEYMVQVTDPNNVVLGEAKPVTIGDKEITYSFISKVKYENKTVETFQDIALPKKAKAVPGVYKINIYDKEVVVATGTFELKK